MAKQKRSSSFFGITLVGETGRNRGRMGPRFQGWDAEDGDGEAEETGQRKGVGARVRLSSLLLPGLLRLQLGAREGDEGVVDVYCNKSTS